MVAGVTATKDEAKITLHKIADAPGVQAKVFRPLAAAGIVVDVIVQAYIQDGRTNLTFTLPSADLARAQDVLIEAVRRHLHARADQARDDLSKVSVVGVGMRSHAGVALKMFEILAQREHPRAPDLDVGDRRILVRDRRR
jgi:aspartate kinase